MHLKLSGKIILRKFLLYREFLWILTPTLKSPFLGFWTLASSILLMQIKPCKSADYLIKVSFHIVVDMRQGESNIFQISTWKAFLLLKIYLLWKIRPISVKGLKLQQIAIVRLNVGTSDCESRTFMNFLNFLRWKSKSWKTTVWDSKDSNKTGMEFALPRDLFYFGFFVAAAQSAG